MGYGGISDSNLTDAQVLACVFGDGIVNEQNAGSG
jgi:hypothetical protein